MEYKFTEIEKKWQNNWDEKKSYKVKKEGKKYYCLEMFPYPSGKLHMGHVRNYSIGDVIARYKKMKGFNVLHPIGWDAFGLPAENAAIKHGVHPKDWTYQNIKVMREQFKTLGFSYDWDREIATCDESYYKWEQLFFIDMFERGLAYKKKSTVNWCGDCATVLANEQVENGKCWRCSSIVTTKEVEQWFFKITNYAEELLSGCDNLTGWPERVRTMQKNWIGKSNGVEVNFDIEGNDCKIYTTRPDTIYGVTFLSLAPENPLVSKIIKGKKEEDSVLSFIEKVRRTTKIERTAEGGVKEGVFTGAYAKNPINNEKVPVYVANFVLMDYGTGAVMAVPAHDQRDFEFAKKYSIPVKRVIYKDNPNEELSKAYEESGTMMNSEKFNGMSSIDFSNEISKYIEERKIGKRTINYKLKDWGISRQRYWGCPIPMVYCEKCGIVPVKKTDLPIKLPNIKLEKIGDNPLSKIDSFIKTNCPKCNSEARRETDTMDTFVESSWYYVRYTSPKDDTKPIDSNLANYWLPVDQYIGGIEHAVMHLLYVRFFHKVLRDFGYLNTDEPANNLLTQGMVVKDGHKMSKSLGNVVDPDYIIKEYGADTARMFSLFAAPPEKDLEWSDKGVEGCSRFLSRIWRLVVNNLEILKDIKIKHVESSNLSDFKLRNLTYKTLSKVTMDLDSFSFNTALAAMMELTNEFYKINVNSLKNEELVAFKESLEILIIMISPFSPHIASELWHILGYKSDIIEEKWPSIDESALKEEEALVIVQVNGKLRSKISIKTDANEEEVKNLSQNEKNVKKFIEGKEIKKIIYVKNKLINIVTS